MEKQEKLFHQIMDYTHSWEYLIGPDSKLVYVSPSCTDYTGHSVQAFLDDENLLLQIVFPEDQNIFRDHLRYEGKDSSPCSMEFRILDASGKVRWFSHSCTPLFDKNGHFLGRRASNHEITDYKEEVQRRNSITKQLKDTTTLLNAVLDAIPDVIGLQDNDHNIIRYNKAGYDYLGKQYEEVKNKKCYELIGNSAPCSICATSEVYTTKKIAKREKYVPEIKAWLDVRAYPVLDDDGNLVKVVEHLRDISREKAAEEQLKQAHDRLITILDSIDAQVNVVDMETNEILFMNSKIKQNFNADFVGKLCHESFRNEPASCPQCTHERLLDNYGQPKGSVTWESSNPITNRWYMNIDRAIQWVDGRIVKLQIATDITFSKDDEKLRHQVQKQLQQSQKLEAIGTLAGGIAHDFNNLLTGILGQASLMTCELDSTHPCRKRVEDIITYSQNAANLTSQLLGFARGGQYEIAPVDINSILVESSSMFGRTKKELRIHTKLTEPDPIVEVDRRQIEQVLLNLYINAWQAMPDGGQIYIETRVVELDSTRHQILPTGRGDFVLISVADVGIGMSKEIMDRIFDPFFTTKVKGRGTGLGLASAYGIINNHNGFINVKSKEGEGSTFEIYLPLSHKQVETTASLREPFTGGQETILLVDDEALVRTAGKDMLEYLGYHVVTADDGKQALSIVKSDKKEPDLIILDLIMPGMDGGETFEAINDFNKTIPVVLASGYSMSGKAKTILEKGCKAFIQKPFDFNTLSTTIRTVLDKSK